MARRTQWLVVLVAVLGTHAVAQGPVAAGGPVLTITPACPVATEDMNTRQYSVEPITVRYSPTAKGAVLKRPSALTLRVALFSLFGQQRVKENDLPMMRQEDGSWSAQFSPSGTEVSSGYLMFDVENERQQRDGNGGRYWDVLLCPTGKDWMPGEVTQARTYNGSPILPGMQRQRDLNQEMSLLRDSCSDLRRCNVVELWGTELQLGNYSAETFHAISREIDTMLDQIEATHGEPKASQYRALLGFVQAYVSRLDPAVIAKMRANIEALPQTEEPMQYDRNMILHPIARTAAWDAAIWRSVRGMLSEMDAEPARAIKDPAARAAAEERVGMEYRDCKELCYATGQSFGDALLSYAAAGDMDGARRVESEWAAWDPKNPDPPASLAKALLEAKGDLAEAQQLANQARTMEAYFADPATFQKKVREVRTQRSYAASPFPTTRWQLDSLIGRIEAAQDNWKAAAVDLQKALDGKPPEALMRDMAYELGQAREHNGVLDSALEAYRIAASAPMQRDASAQEAYVQLYVAQHKGTAAQAKQELGAVDAKRERKGAEEYVPVELHRTMPELKMTSLGGQPVVAAVGRRPRVMQLWATWCAPCVGELPSMLQFQKEHPEVDFIAADIGEDAGKVRAFLQEQKLTGLHVALMADVPREISPGIPSTLVIGPQGELNFLHVGGSAVLPALLKKDLSALRTTGIDPVVSLKKK